MVTNANPALTLNRARPYGTISGGAPSSLKAKYTQDGNLFNARGEYVGKWGEPAAEAVAEPVKPEKKQKAEAPQLPPGLPSEE